MFHFRSGTYDLTEGVPVEDGTKIVIHLKNDCANFSEEGEIKGKATPPLFYY